MTGAHASAPIDDFLAGAGETAVGERFEAIGAGIAIGGLVLAVGLIVFLAMVHVGQRSELTRLLRLVTFAGALLFVGGIVEVAGTSQVFDVPWSEALTNGSASSAMMRVCAGLSMVFGFAEETVPVGGLPRGPGTAPIDGDPPAAVRWFPGAASAFGLGGTTLGVLSFSFDGHTITEGPRLAHAGVNVVHVLAGGMWFGGVVGLLVVATVRRRAGSVGPLVVRFSRVATVALGMVFVAGVIMAAMILDDPDELTGTDWGRRLLVKTAAVGAAALLGAYHHLVVAPRLATGDVAVERTARRTIAAEAAVLAFAVVITPLLTRASPS